VNFREWMQQFIPGFDPVVGYNFLWAGAELLQLCLLLYYWERFTPLGRAVVLGWASLNLMAFIHRIHWALASSLAAPGQPYADWSVVTREYLVVVILLGVYFGMRGVLRPIFVRYKLFNFELALIAIVVGVFVIAGGPLHVLMNRISGGPQP